VPAWGAEEGSWVEALADCVWLAEAEVASFALQPWRPRVVVRKA